MPRAVAFAPRLPSAPPASPAGPRERAEPPPPLRPRAVKGDARAAIAECGEGGTGSGEGTGVGGGGTGLGGGELTRDPEATQCAQRGDEPASGHPQRWRRRE